MVAKIATGEIEEAAAKDVAEVRKRAGAKGARARAEGLTRERRSEIAHHAAKARWSKPD